MLEEAKLLDDDYDADGRRTWGTNIDLDGVTYATSLFWQPLQNKDDPFTEVGEASEGVMEGADLFCIKQGKAPQFGICASKEGYKSGENVAAVTLATVSSSEVGPVRVTSAGTLEERLRMKPSAIDTCEVSTVTGRTFSLTSSKTTVTVVGFSTVRVMLKFS